MFQTSVLVAAFFFAGLRSCVALDGAWLFNVDQATQTAQLADRLLIVVQFDADFLQSPQDSKELATYEQVAFDSIGRSWLQENSVLVAENVGRPAILLAQRPKRAAQSNGAKTQSIGNVITWFCRSDGVVISCLIGYPASPSFLLVEAKRCNQAIRQFNPGPNQQEIQTWHLSDVAAQDTQLFDRFLKREQSPRATQRQQHIDAAVASLARVRQRRIEQRIGANWSIAETRNLTRSFANHAAFEHRLNRLLMAEVPDATVAEWEHPVWQMVANTNIWRSNREELASWLERQSASAQPIVLRILDSKGRLPDWPSSPAGRKLIQQSATRESSLADVAVVANHLQTKPLVTSGRHKPTFFVAAADGQAWKLLTSRNSKSDFTAELKQISTMVREGR